MKLNHFDTSIVLIANPKPARPRHQQQKTAFTLACEAVGHHPRTIKDRLVKNPGMTLEEALSYPPGSKRDCGRLGGKNTHQLKIRKQA